MVEVNSDDYNYTHHEQLLYDIAMELRKIQEVYAQSPNERKLVNVSFDLDSKKIRISASLDTYDTFAEGGINITVSSRYTYSEPAPES